MTTSKSTARIRKEKYLAYMEETKKVIDAHEAGELSDEEAHKKFNAIPNPLFE